MAVINQVVTDDYAIYNGDSAEVLELLPDNSVGMSIYSPPFAIDGASGGGGALYNYSSSVRDLSNARSYKEFFQHYEFICEHITRATKPGRISAVHCMDVPTGGANICGYSDFPGDIIKLHQKLGWEYLPRICIWKEPLSVRNRTMSKALTHRQICEDMCQTNVAAADYLIPFRKKGENKEPVTHKHGLLEYHGERKVPSELHYLKGFKGNQIENRYSHWIWRHYASCFWDDIRVMEVLPYEGGKDEQDEKHQHPLQLDVINRAVDMWTNPGDVVLTPFMGVGSEVYGAVINGRKGIGCELKTSYFNQAVKNLARAAELSKKTDVKERTLLDGMDEEQPQELSIHA